MTLGWGIQPQITRSPQRPQMENDRRREHMSPAPQKKKYISTTNRHGGALPIATGALWAPLHVYSTTINHHGGATNTTLWTPPHPYIPPTTKHHGGTANTHSLDTFYSYYQAPLIYTPHPLPISTDAHSLDTPNPLQNLPLRISTDVHSLDTHYIHPAMVALPLSACLGACLGCRRA